MNKSLTAKRLLKRHKRHASSQKNWADTSKPKLGTLARIRAVQGVGRRGSKSLAKAGNKP
jgi:hypothetical protein